MGDGIFILVILIYSLVVFVLSKISDEIFEYKDYLIIKSIEKFSLPFLFSILSVFSCFIEFEYWVTYIAFILFSVFSLLYFFYDYFYLQQYEKEYIVNLQSKNLIEKNIKDIFDVKKTSASYEPTTKIDGINGFSITKSEYGECIQLKGTEESVLYIPKEKMSIEKMKYCMKELSLDIKKTTINVYPEDYEDDMYSRFIYWRENKIYSFLKKFTKNKAILILTIIIFVIMLLLVILIFLDYCNIIDLDAIINLKRK